LSILSGQLIALDTNVLVDVLRNNAYGQYIANEYGLTTRPERPLFSTVTEGEILGLAKAPKWKWGPKKLDDLQDLLDQLVRIDAGLPEVVSAYSDLYALSFDTGNPTGENDLWIAATTKATNSVLITRDKDFDWMKDAGLVDIERVESN
jgi:tRNA(fMet)-specific endonuclease VapC